MELLRYKKSTNPPSKEKPPKSAKNKLNLWLIGILAIANKNDSYDWSKKAVNITLINVVSHKIILELKYIV